jgi:hypothetical protein
MTQDAVAVITVHGIADQQPGQTVHELARLLCHGGDGAPRYVDGELHEVIVPVSPLRPFGAGGEVERAAAAHGADESLRARLAVVPGRTSDFFARRRAARGAGPARAEEDLGLALTDHLLSQYRPAQRDGLYQSTRATLRRHADGTRVDLYEMYWADYSRLQPGGIRALSATYQLLFHLNTLARDIVDQVVLASDDHATLRLLQRLHAWSAWLLKGPAALLQLAMLLLVAFGMAAFVPTGEHRFVLALGGSVAAIVLAIGAWLATQRTDTAAAAFARALPWLLGALACAGVAAATLSQRVPIEILYVLTAALLATAAGLALVRRYARTVRDVQAVGLAVVVMATLLLGWNAYRDYAHASTLYEWILTAALHTGEYLLAALLLVWGVLVVVQSGALALSFVLARSGVAGVAESLATARIGLSVSTATFVMLSLVLWSVIGYVIGLALKDLLFVPALLGESYRSGALFFEAQLTDVGAFFTPLMALVGVIGVIALVALAPSLREELAPTPVKPDAHDDALSARLGGWWTGARALLNTLFGTVVPLLALASGAVYLLFLLEKLLGFSGLFALLGAVGVTWGAVLVSVGKWLAGGAVTVTALGARFTQTFGKLRVALDAVLDVDNYFLDPHNHKPPRARIFSRYAALLDYIRQRGYARVVIVAHSQGTVISADLLRYLARSGRLAAATGGLPVTLMTVGSPLRDLYAARFPLLYRWMGRPAASFDDAGPAAAELGIDHWVNAFRAGDYVGRALWTPASDGALFSVARLDAQGHVVATRHGDRSEFCLGAGAHTHYFTDDALALAAELDRLIAAAPVPPGR